MYLLINWEWSSTFLVFFFSCLSAACPVGYFKSVSGSVPCSVCPSNSRTSQEGSSVCECRSGFYRAANDVNSSACTSELCWFVCLCLSLWEVSSGPRWSIYLNCEDQDVQSVTRIHPTSILSRYNSNLIPPAKKKQYYFLCSLCLNCVSAKLCFIKFFPLLYVVKCLGQHAASSIS